MTEIQLTVSAEQREMLLSMLRAALGDARVEVRRTHNPSFRDQLQHEEAVVRDLIVKLEQPAVPG